MFGWIGAVLNLLKMGAGRTQAVASYLWSREPGRFLDAIDRGRFLKWRESGRYLPAVEMGRYRWAREPGRFLMASQSEWMGTFFLPVGGPSGGKRRFGVHFADMEEIIAGETLTGTPTVSVAPAGPTITSVSYSGSDLLFTVAAGTSAAGDYTLTFHAETSGGAILEPTATLKLE